METDPLITCILEELVSSITATESRFESSKSCYDFDDDAPSPVKLDLKRRHHINDRDVFKEKSGDGKRFRLCSDKRVGYVFSPDLIKEVSRLPKVQGRAHQVHELIASYKLLSRLRILPSRKATDDELRSFHSQEYIEYMKTCDGGGEVNEAGGKTKGQNLPRKEDEGIENKFQEKDGDVNKKQGSQDCNVSILDTSQRGEEDFGLGYDCPLLPNIFNLIKLIAGSTLTAVESIISGQVDIAINWTGGWHHALKDTASGFCYVNDIVIGILKLLSHGYTKVLYVDFDLHHGDGVELAFGHSSKVFTLSFHKYEVGFFPGTGSLTDIGSNGSKGKGYAMNVPLKSGINDHNYTSVAIQILNKVIKKFQPQVIVAQFGADGLVSDPMNSFNLTPNSFVNCSQLLISTCIPMVVLGGGGYNIPDTARCWTRLTASAIGCEVENDIPDSDPFFLTYGPSYELNIYPGLRKDENLYPDVQILLQKVSENLNGINCTS